MIKIKNKLFGNICMLEFNQGSTDDIKQKESRCQCLIKNTVLISNVILTVLGLALIIFAVFSKNNPSGDLQVPESLINAVFWLTIIAGVCLMILSVLGCMGAGLSFVFCFLFFVFFFLFFVFKLSHLQNTNT